MLEIDGQRCCVCLHASSAGADPGFLLGGGALVFCSTSTPINHIVLFLQNTSCIRKPQVISGMGGWVSTLTELFPKIQANAGSWLCTKKSFVLLCPIGEQFLLSSFREFVHDGYCLATLARFVHQFMRVRETFIFYFPNQQRRNYRWVEKTFGMLSAGAIQFAPRIFCFWLITMYRK